MMDLPHSRVRVTASQSRRRATGSIPVEGSSRKMTGGPPIRAMPALSFRLLPPLWGREGSIEHRKARHGRIPQPGGASAPWSLLSPVGPDKLVGVGLQQQPPQHVLHAAADVTLRDAPQPGIHAERLTACHVLQQGIKLRAVADPLLHLGARRS